ncbi:MAG TPA: quinone-dependent dihydroorotate dehydrogenase [Rhizomicrobium sp.]|nr:quinone-dependent dihydroorotate dehydrogenase [Rhizomicrobium sp.]
MLLDAGARMLRQLPPETSHRATIRLLSAGGAVLPAALPDDPKLAVTALGLRFPNPIGLAAGFDKDGEVPDAMLKLGFGFVEIGTVTPRSQAGNPQPRLFRLPEDRAVINRMGFNNAGMEAMARRLAKRKRNGILGINIGTNKDSSDRIADYRAAFARLAPFADYVTINVSSPNTPGLRTLQGRDELERLLGAVNEERAKLPRPLLLKIAPDLDDAAIDDVADVALAAGLDGIIATNTTIDRSQGLRSANARETGGLSGAPLFQRSTEVLKALRAKVGSRITLVGVGGIGSGADAYAKIQAGASLVQLYTALAYEGPGLISRIKRELLQCLEQDGFDDLDRAGGR